MLALNSFIKLLLLLYFFGVYYYYYCIVEYFIQNFDIQTVHYTNKLVKEILISNSVLTIYSIK